MDQHRHFSVDNLLRYLLAAVALAWVLTTVDWGRLFQLLGEMPSAIIVSVIVVSALGLVPLVWMWKTLLRGFGPVSFVNALRADLVIKFVNILSPSRFSGRLVAPIALRQFTGIDWKTATAVTGVHTGLYAICYAVACLIGFAVLLPHLSVGVLAIVGLSTVVYGVGASLVITGGWHVEHLEPVFEGLVSKVGRAPLVGDRIASLLTGSPAVVADSAVPFRATLTNRRAVLGYGWWWVLALAVLPGIRVYLLFVGFGVTPEDPLLLPLYLITAYAVTILPLTPGGIGVAEATSTLVFLELGYPSTIIVPVVILDRFLGVYLPAMVGWYPAMSIDFDNIRQGPK